MTEDEYNSLSPLDRRLRVLAATGKPPARANHPTIAEKAARLGDDSLSPMERRNLTLQQQRK